MKKSMFVRAMFLFVLLLVGRSAHAQVYYPGSVWTNTGTPSPVEGNNIKTATVVEQGVALNGVQLFGSLNTTFDSKGLDWNRSVIKGVGARYTFNISTGYVRANVLLVNEHRFVSGADKTGVQVSVDAWFGWNSRPKK